MLNYQPVTSTPHAFTISQEVNSDISDMLNYQPVRSSLLNAFTISHRLFTDAATAITLLTMMSLQTTRRLLECFCVSIYSDSTMNVFHYMYGVLFYISFWVTVLSEAPRFDMGNGKYTQTSALKLYMIKCKKYTMNPQFTITSLVWSPH